jgi:polysaccharide pyruvyl transferase WcaK-like protein
MKRVTIVGLNSLNNMGDRILVDTAKYLVDQSSDGKIETKILDVEPKYLSIFKRIPGKIISILYSICRRLYKTWDLTWMSKLKYCLIMAYVKIKYERYYWKMIHRADAIIFAGGGFIKYETQLLCYYVNCILRLADKCEIPVMFNAIGVEGFNDKDIRCMHLKSAINRSCVKMITTRDDIQLLKEKYIIDKKAIVEKVADPALWVPECYGIAHRNEHEPIVVGVGSIRYDIFSDYGYAEFDNRSLVNLYLDIFSELEKRNIEWKMFTNGLEADVVFAKRVLADAGYNPDTKLLDTPNTPIEFINTLKLFNGIIAGRMHAYIVAYAMSIPAISYVWNIKVKLLGEAIKREEYFVEKINFNGKYIVDRLLQVMKEPYDLDYRITYREKTKQYIKKFIKSLE